MRRLAGSGMRRLAGSGMRRLATHQRGDGVGDGDPDGDGTAHSEPRGAHRRAFGGVDHLFAVDAATAELLG